MKISFKVEITGCSETQGHTTKNCPHLHDKQYQMYCYKTGSHKTVRENIHKLTKTCPVIKKKLEKEADRMDAYLFKLESETTDPN